MDAARSGFWGGGVGVAGVTGVASSTLGLFPPISWAIDRRDDTDDDDDDGVDGGATVFGSEGETGVTVGTTFDGTASFPLVS